MNLSEWSKEIGGLMGEKGFHDGRTNTRDDTLVRLCLVHTEVSEAAQEAKRHWVGEGDPDVRRAVCRELGDAIYRILDLMYCLNVCPELLMEEIHAANAARPKNYGTPEEAR